MVSEGGCFEMTKEGAEIIKDAVKVILEQCYSTISCKNCPLYDCKDLHCEDLVDCIPDH